jgi:hypothetical protein
MDSHIFFSPAPHDKAMDGVPAESDGSFIEFATSVTDEAPLSHADALRNLAFQSELREFNRLKALERIIAWGEAYQEALGLSTAELERLSQWARHYHEKAQFRGETYETFYRFTVPAGLLDSIPVDFGLVFFTITLAGKKPQLLLAPLCLNPQFADAFHHGTGMKSDVVFYAREEVHEAILTTLSGKLA